MNMIETLEKEEMARLGKTIPEFAPGDYDFAVILHGVASTGFIGLHVSDKRDLTTLPVD